MERLEHFDDENLSHDYSHSSSCTSQDSTFTNEIEEAESRLHYGRALPSLEADGQYQMNTAALDKKSRLTHRKRSQITGLLFFVILTNLLDTTSGFQLFTRHGHNLHRLHETKVRKLHARSSPPTEEVIKPVQPLKSSTKERRLSVQKAWEKAQVLARDDVQDESLSATPFLDLFTDAGIGTVKKGINKKERNVTHTRPRGRPESVPGAMSRTTLLNLNEIQSRSYVKSNGATNIGIKRQVGSTDIPAPPKKRGRGRPRKNPSANDASVDEITAIAATTAMEPQESPVADYADLTDAELEEESSEVNGKQKKQRVKILPKSRKLKQTENEGVTTGMMQSGKRGRKGDIEPPNLQKYYRTELLTQEEEYTLGMKIQFLVKCEQVHEGLFQILGRAPSIAEWAQACGFEEIDPIRSKAGYKETGLEKQIRPVTSEAWEVEQDPNMFVGNGLAHDSGPGRGRGRAKKAPPTSLKDYYDDSAIRFTDKKIPKSKQIPINRGSPDDFIELMLNGKEAKQKMVQCNMRLVVSIAKRYKHVGVNIADLVQEGSIGLTRAAEKFDPKKGFKFSTYASW